MSRRLPFLVILLGSALLLLRVLVFAGQHGGIEHDSGWFLGVARNLAEHGIYASYTNTIPDREEPGVGQSIHGRPSVQDEHGYTYFPAGDSVGPAYTIPEALIIRIFGNGLWQYRLWPLLTFTILLLLASAVIWKIGGTWGVLLFQVWLWLVPNVYLIFAFEAFSEPIATMYLLLGIVCYALSFEKKTTHRTTLMAAFGVLAGLAVLTKTVALMSAAMAAPLFLWELIEYRKEWRKVMLRWAIFAAAALAPFVLFELYRFIALTSQFGMEGWYAANKDFVLHFDRASNSGLPQDWHLVISKLKMWNHAGIRAWVAPAVVIWTMMLLGPVLVMPRLPKPDQKLLRGLLCGTLCTFVWFIVLDQNARMRYGWIGLMFSMILLCAIAGFAMTGFWKHKRTKWISAACLLFVLVGMEPAAVYPQFFLTPEMEVQWKMLPTAGPMETLPHVPVFSLEDQTDMARYIQTSLAPNDRIHYLGGLLVTEMAAISGRVFYPIGRYEFNKGNPDGGRSFVILGPYQRGPLSADVDKCEGSVHENASYQLCLLP